MRSLLVARREAAAAAPLPPPPLSLAGGLGVCGGARCLTRLALHTGDVAPAEAQGLADAHPHLQARHEPRRASGQGRAAEGAALVVPACTCAYGLRARRHSPLGGSPFTPCLRWPSLAAQRLELWIGRCGSPHVTPPLVQFQVGLGHVRRRRSAPRIVTRGLTATAHCAARPSPPPSPRPLAPLPRQAACLPRLRHLALCWAGPGEGGAALSSRAHGPRRLFLDGRPRLGPQLLGGLGGLPRLEGLALRVRGAGVAGEGRQEGLAPRVPCGASRAPARTHACGAHPCRLVSFSFL